MANGVIPMFLGIDCSGVARDGGNVRFVDFDQGVLYLEMQGACAGCPAAGRTLKSGIEKIMQAHIPDVLEVVGV